MFSINLDVSDIDQLTSLSDIYFAKFLWPIQELDKPYDVISEARSYLVSKSRNEKAIQILTRIIQTNVLFEGKVGPKLFRED
ncbi:unnamed protein product, partial [marine sediment metagenome]